LLSVANRNHRTAVPKIIATGLRGRTHNHCDWRGTGRADKRPVCWGVRCREGAGTKEQYRRSVLTLRRSGSRFGCSSLRNPAPAVPGRGPPQNSWCRGFTPL